ncbi:hypothetical protein [Myxococcus fulvus]|uniref:hypothetical protein n=1 Tax=Myxococcus fulvus TaxID=33 RepID=UPI0020C07906|nr:hypothetical protein [Myxococcus fulvus]
MLGLMACGSREQAPPPLVLGASVQAMRGCPAARSASVQDSCMAGCHLGCGDGVCQDETEATCPVDCFCGDGVCTAEDVNSCPVDCGCPGSCAGACHTAMLTSARHACPREAVPGRLLPGDPFAIPDLRP